MWVKVPKYVQNMFPKQLWRAPGDEKAIYLTFDDGPIPKITPWVLSQLKVYDAKATFFCIGDNIRKHPDILEQVLCEGHRIGNHTDHHLNGWKTPAEKYLVDVKRAAAEIEKYKTIFQQKNETAMEQKLFRPPYGKISGRQASLVQKEGYRIVMWEVLSRDYEQKTPPEKVLENVIKNTEAGSIVIFHDSLKAEKNLKAVLPQVLRHYSELGYTFKSLC